MTHAAPRKRGGRAWIVPAVGIGLLAIAVGINWLSRSIVLDFIAWWPVWLILGGVFVWSRGRKLGKFRVSGLVSVAMLFVLLLFVVGHRQGWPIMPSSSVGLVGDVSTLYEEAALSARIGTGKLSLFDDQSGPLYTVQPKSGGGEIALPNAEEQTQANSISVALTPTSEPGLYRYSGWLVGLAPGPAWSLNLEGEIDADLSQLGVVNLQIEGSGHVVLGPVSQSTPVSVSGNFVIEVELEQAVRVIGPAQIPEDWTRTETGATSPISGQGWVISVADGSVLQIKNS